MDESIIDVHYMQNFTLQKVVYNLPPNTEKLFNKWLKTSQCEDWNYRWDFLRKLTINDYLRMFAVLPSLLIKKIPDENSPEFKVFDSYSNQYKYISIWLIQLFDYTLPNIKEIYNSKELKLYRHQANISEAELKLANAIFRHPKYELSDIFYNPIYLWFWIQVANCLKYLKNSGVFEPIDIKDIKTKRESVTEWGKLLSYYKDSYGSKINLKKSQGWRDYLENLPAILPIEAKELLHKKDDLLLENALKGYINAHHALKHLTHKNSQYQLMKIYETNKSTELFVTGKKKKRPEC